MNLNYTSLLKERIGIRQVYRYRYYIFALPLAIATILLLLINIGVEVSFKSNEIRISWPQLVKNTSVIGQSEDKYFIKTEGCTIPAFHPFDRGVVKYFQMESPISCHNSSSPPLVESNLTSLWIEEKYFSNYDITEEQHLLCCYRPFFRQDSNISTSDDRYEYEKDCTVFSKSTNVFDEFVRVECTYKGSDIYKDFHSFVMIKNIAEDVSATKRNEYSYNVLVLGIDAVSRLNFHRTMPKTLKILKSMGAIEFRGYNKVGDNTYPNLVPVLSGLSESELQDHCLPRNDSTYDDCPFIWKKYKESGYMTAFAEDASGIGVFNYMKKGFINAPTDYYWRTFNQAAELEIGHEIHSNTNLCIGPRIIVDVLLDYIYKFLTVLSNNLYFGFFWETSLTHDFLNYPLLGDNKYSSLMYKLKEEGLFSNTIVVVMSDHGIRWGEILSTPQGRMEERLPFLFITLPEIFKERFPLASSNLKRNTKRLTTPYDLHETFSDLLNVSQIENEVIEQAIHNKTYENNRGISLFLPIHENRTCQSAGIDPHWCTCHESRKLNVDDKVVVIVANVVINYMNGLLANYTQCAKLNLSGILEAGRNVPSKSLEMWKVLSKVQDYTVIINTEPGDGLFEATVRHSLRGWNVTGTISRHNLYGKQSYCIDDVHLKLYCFCNSPISKMNLFG
ncbi:uncharacterized protein LOC143918426 [Arctopsyche grandis]|uniref:uncharacterized protein LOC143918426 n=1 Tax=Arctopsyche grandis TaxID=121162 RepID=UPI00406D84AE